MMHKLKRIWHEIDRFMSETIVGDMLTGCMLVIVTWMLLILAAVFQER